MVCEVMGEAPGKDERVHFIVLRLQL
jgi:hypothetical protein